MKGHFCFDDFPYEIQDALYGLKWDVRDGNVNEGFEPPEINYLYWATCAEGRYGRSTPWLVTLMVDLAQIGVQYMCHEKLDSWGDRWMQTHRWYGGQAA